MRRCDPFCAENVRCIKTIVGELRGRGIFPLILKPQRPFYTSRVTVIRLLPLCLWSCTSYWTLCIYRVFILYHRRELYGFNFFLHDTLSFLLHQTCRLSLRSCVCVLSILHIQCVHILSSAWALGFNVFAGDKLICYCTISAASLS